MKCSTVASYLSRNRDKRSFNYTFRCDLFNIDALQGVVRHTLYSTILAYLTNSVEQSLETVQTEFVLKIYR